MNQRLGLAAGVFASLTLVNIAVAAEPQEAPAAQAAQAQPPTPHVLATPGWAAIPSGDDVARLYPSGARNRRLNGFVEISCQVLATGYLAECKVLVEDPARWKFGEAALKLSQLFKMRPTTRDGASVAGATVRIPIRFEIFGEN